MFSRLIYKWFTQKRCKLKFRKDSVWENSNWYEISDSTLMKYLKDLQNDYTFTILKMDLTSYDCTVVIRCNQADKYKIFTDFCEKAGKYIEHVRIY